MPKHKPPKDISPLNPPVDAVISWVDGRDPEHAKLRQEYETAYHDTHTKRRVHIQPENDTSPNLASEINAPRRWSYANELDICLRSLERHAPWIRTIYIVTNGQIPGGLDRLPVSLQSKIKIVTHDIIFKNHSDWLPTFNSMAIESMIWNIPNLAERFIYFNDDMFLAGPCTAELFFKDDMTTLMGKWLSIPERKLGKFKKSIYRYAKLNAAKAFDFSNARFFSSAHVAIPMRVSIMRQIYVSGQDWLQHNAASRFRGADQYLVQGLFAHCVLRENKAVLSNRAYGQNLSASYCKHMPFIGFCINAWLIRLFPKRFRLICVNDLTLLNQRFHGRADPLIRKAIGID